MAVKHGIDIDELLDGGMMDRARIRARSRLVDSVDSKEGVEVASIGDIHTEEGRLLEAFSFYYARLVVGASEDERLISPSLEVDEYVRHPSSVVPSHE